MYSQIEDSWALFEQRRAEWLKVSGEDRLRFVNGLVTCDVRHLEPGMGAYGFFTDAQGKVMADVVVSALEEHLLLEVPAGTGASLTEHLEKYVVADRVEIQLHRWASALFIGSRVPEMLQGHGIEAPEAGGWKHALNTDVGFLTRSERRVGTPAWTVCGANEAVAGVVDRFREEARLADPQKVSVLRVERGIAWFGVDFTPGEYFPQETGLEPEAVSYDKGCYLGQEVIARIHYRGKVNRSLRGIEAGAGVELTQGRKVLAAGKEVGTLTSPVFSPSRDRWIALCILHRHGEEAGVDLVLETGEPVRMVELPFVPAADVDRD